MYLFFDSFLQQHFLTNLEMLRLNSNKPKQMFRTINTGSAMEYMQLDTPGDKKGILGDFEFNEFCVKLLGL